MNRGQYIGAVAAPAGEKRAGRLLTPCLKIVTPYAYDRRASGPPSPATVMEACERNACQLLTKYEPHAQMAIL